MYIRSRICRLPPHSCLTITLHHHCKHTRHTYFSDHSKARPIENQDTFSISNIVYFFVFHNIPHKYPNMRPTPAMFQQVARSAPGFLQRLAKSPMAPPVEVLPILILPVGMVRLTPDSPHPQSQVGFRLTTASSCHLPHTLVPENSSTTAT